MARRQFVVGTILACAALVAVLIALSFLGAASGASFLVSAALGAVGGMALIAALAFGCVAWLSFRGGLVAQLLSLLLSAVVLLRLGPYFVIIVRRGDDVTWVAPVGVATLLFLVVLGASAYGLLRRRAHA